MTELRHFYALDYFTTAPLPPLGTCQHPEHQDELCPLHAKFEDCVKWKKRR